MALTSQRIDLTVRLGQALGLEHRHSEGFPHGHRRAIEMIDLLPEAGQLTAGSLLLWLLLPLRLLLELLDQSF